MKKIILALALGMVLTACGNDQAKENTENKEVSQSVEDKEVSKNEEDKEQRPLVYTSFYPIYNITKQIAGDKMDVRAFNSLTSESHGWEPAAKDMAELSESNIMFINGAGMEEWKDSVDETVDIAMVDTSEGLDLIKADGDHDHDHAHDEEEHDHAHEDHDHDHDEENHDDEGEGHHHHHHGEFDPHTWLSPINVADQARVIADKLKEIDPENADYYEENYNKLKEELDAITEEYKEKFAGVSNNKFIVPHQAFGYVARDFGLEQIPLTSLTSTDDPDAKAMKEVTDLAKDNKLNTVFYEKGGSDKAAKTIAGEIGAETAPLDTMEFASEEDLEKEVTIQEIIKENLENIYKSLA